MAFVNDRQEVVGEIVDETLARRAGGTSRKRTRIVLDAVAVAELAHHLDVVLGPLPQALRFQELVLRGEELESVGELGLDAFERRSELVLAHHELLRRRDDRGRHRHAAFARQRIEFADAVDLLAEELDADRLRLIGRKDVHDVAADAEDPGLKADVVAHVLGLDEIGDEFGASARRADLHLHRQLAVFVGLAQAVDAAHGRDDDHVLTGDERIRGRQAVAFDLLVDRGVLLDVGVRLGDVGLRLVIVVIGDEVLDRVVREEFLEFGEELRRKRLVVRENERRTIPLRNQVRHREGLARARHALQNEPFVAALQSFMQGGNGIRLIARGLELRMEIEKSFAHFPSWPAVIHFAVSVSPLSVVADCTSLISSGSA